MESRAFHTFFHALIFSSTFFKFSIAADTFGLNQSLTDGETLVSPGQKFELGFFSPGASKQRYLGIWYLKIPATVVWVANRNNPIPDSQGVLTISSNKELVILNGNQSIIWSSNSSRMAAAEKSTPVAQLLDSGNLVLVGSTKTNSGGYLWQSFDLPCDTQLPGMKLGENIDTGLDQHLTSWRSAGDPSPGEFTFKIENNGLPQLVISMGSTKVYRSGPWNGLRFSGLPLASYPYLTIMEFNQTKLISLFDPYNSVIARSTLILSGSLEHYVLNEQSSTWKLFYTLPNDLCDNYGQCGPNGICRIGNSNTPLCECLKGFSPKSQQEWEVSSGCVRSVPLDCQKGEGFVKVAQVKLPDLLDQFQLNTSMNLKECEEECLRKCSCIAYANSNISEGGSGCLMWFGDLIDTREFIQRDDSQQDIYIRLPASMMDSTSKIADKKRDSKSKRWKWIILALAVSLTLLTTAFFYCMRRRKLHKEGEDLSLFDLSTSIGARNSTLTEATDSQKRRKKEVDLPRFRFASVSAATDNFSDANKLGEGGFGPVYKGKLLKGYEVAVKRLSRKSGQGLEELQNEAMLIAKLQHKNLVRLLGCCIEGDEKILIYEYMPNKSLDFFLFDPIKYGILSWELRLNIIEGIAQGLLYLHQYSRVRIIHRDLKASNILLDKDMNPKISDFGMARIFGGNGSQATNRIVGTYGYMSPEYALEGLFSIKSDVFSFGVLMLEILSGKKNTGFYNSDYLNLLGYAWDLWKNGKGQDVKDPILEDTSSTNMLLRYINVALLCVQESAADRPTMLEVVSMLNNELALLPSPKQPAFSTSRSVLNQTSCKSSKICSVNDVTVSILEAR